MKEHDLMIKILFVCHGNICRSPMAEFVFRDMVIKRSLGDRFHIASAATSTEELGNPVHYGTVNKLKQYGISTAGKYAVQLKKKDYKEYDYLIGMEYQNIRNINRIIGSDPEHKVCRLLDFSDNPRDIADPWYTGNFDRTYDDIVEGCEGLLDFLLKNGLK
jgi:protein-tyrosine phosphatase